MPVKILLLLGVALIFLAGTGQSQNVAELSKVSTTAIYPKIRIWTTPSMGEEPRFNSPSFQWPTKKKASYSIRISSSRNFAKEVIEKHGIPFAIFNPHKRLAPGIWYWQYSVNDEKWNPVDSFTIKSSTRIFETPDPKILLGRISATHPRVLLKKEEKIRIKAKAYRETVLILQEADSYLNMPVPNESSVLPTFKGKDDFENTKIASIASKFGGWKIRNAIVSLSEAYLLTGDEKYFNAAKKWMLEVSGWDPNGPSHINNFGDAGIMSGLAIGVDTFWDLLSASERDRIVKPTTIRASQFYKLWIGQVESRSSSMHVWQHILHNLLQTTLAFRGHVPEADLWFEYCYELWIAQSPKMGEEDGAWFNGTSYFGMNMLSLVDVSTIFKDLSGVDFMGSDWFKFNPNWLIYSFPAGSVSDGFCNDGERWAQPPINYAGYADAMARLFQQPYAEWYAQSLAKSLGKEVADDPEFRWFRIRSGLKMNLPSPVKEFNLPQAACFPEIGVAYMHTTLQKTATDLMLSVRSSPYGPMAHAHADQNTFNIALGGKRLFYNTGYRPAMGDPHYLGWYKDTRGHNGILINDKGQPFSDESYGWIPRFLHGNQISYSVADASNAYSGTDEEGKIDRGLKLFKRHFLMLRPSTIVIYDELEADHPVSWSWLLHNDNGFTIDPENKTIAARNEAGKALVSLFSSTPLDFQVTDQFSVPVDNWTNKIDEEGDTLVFQNQWHFRGNSKEKSEKMRFLAIFQVKSDGGFGKVNSLNNGGTFTVGGWSVRAALDVNQKAKIEVSNQDGSAVFCSDGVLRADGKKYEGTVLSSSKLFEKINGKSFFRETGDNLPSAIQKALKYQNR